MGLCNCFRSHVRHQLQEACWLEDQCVAMQTQRANLEASTAATLVSQTQQCLCSARTSADAWARARARGPRRSFEVCAGRADTRGACTPVMHTAVCATPFAHAARAPSFAKPPFAHRRSCTPPVVHTAIRTRRRSCTCTPPVVHAAFRTHRHSRTPPVVHTAVSCTRGRARRVVCFVSPTGSLADYCS